MGRLDNSILDCQTGYFRLFGVAVKKRRIGLDPLDGQRNVDQHSQVHQENLRRKGGSKNNFHCCVGKLL